ncbi:MAG: helix-turn-helix domain-containing protein [Deltaproteobacteria bacterium]|nr:helix-turn-helix domain-containing protein [Deltaproteobacteria bacterium]
MAEQSGSGRGKGRKNVSLDEHEKKAILDTVSQSEKPVAQILRELGLSRSTYYNWLSRYEEEGLEGLKDKRDSEKPLSAEETPIPEAEEVTTGAGELEEDKPTRPEAETKPPEIAEVTQREQVRGSSPYSDTIAPKMQETPRWKAPEPTVRAPEATKPEMDAAKVPKSGTRRMESRVEPKKEEPKLAEKTIKPQTPKSPPSDLGGSKRRSTFFTLLVIIAVIAGVVITISMYNASGYFFKSSDGTLTLWKGKFAPFGTMEVSGFKRLDVGSIDVSPVLNHRYYGEWEAVNALFSHIMNQAELSMEEADASGVGSPGPFLGLAEELANGGEPGAEPNRRSLSFKYRLLQKRISHMEKSLAAMYRDLTGVLSDLKVQNVPIPGNIEQMINESTARAVELEGWISPGASAETAQKTSPAQPPTEEPAATKVGPESKEGTD